MAFADKLKKLDAHRLQQSVKATVQSNGRLTFTVEATKEMGLSEEKSLIIFEADGGDLGAVISIKNDPEAFILKKCGLYYYVAFKNYLQQAGIDYKNQRIIYDITELDEKIEGKTLYQFARRVLPKMPEQLPITGISNAGNKNPSVQQDNNESKAEIQGEAEDISADIILTNEEDDIPTIPMEEFEYDCPPPPPAYSDTPPTPPATPKMPRRPPPPPMPTQAPSNTSLDDMPY